MSFEKRIESLKEFKKEYGHCNVPNSYKKDPTLGAWVKSVRNSYARMKIGKNHTIPLPQKRLKQLERIGFEWRLRDPKIPFDARIKQLRKFKSEFGHVDVPQIYKENPSLGYWVHHMRQAYRLFKMGKKSGYELSKERIEMLDKMGFVWSKDADRELKFMEMCQKLQEYKEKHGDCNVPHRYKQNKPLGLWVSDLRTSYRFRKKGVDKKGKRCGYDLTDDRIRRLESMGFEWSRKK